MFVVVILHLWTQIALKQCAQSHLLSNTGQASIIKAFAAGLSPPENTRPLIIFSFHHNFLLNFYFSAFYLKADLPQMSSSSLSEGLTVMVRGTHASADALYCWWAKCRSFLNALWIMSIGLVLWILLLEPQDTCSRTRLRTPYLNMSSAWTEYMQKEYNLHFLEGIPAHTSVLWWNLLLAPLCGTWGMSIAHF